MIGNTIFASYRVLAFQASRRWLNINCHSHNPIYHNTCGFRLPEIYHIQNGDTSVSYEHSSGLASILARIPPWAVHIITVAQNASRESRQKRACTPHHLDLHRSGDQTWLAEIHLRGRRRACCSLFQPFPFHGWLFSFHSRLSNLFRKNADKNIRPCRHQPRVQRLAIAMP